jgi:hypothetical protein
MISRASSKSASTLRIAPCFVSAISGHLSTSPLSALQYNDFPVAIAHEQNRRKLARLLFVNHGLDVLGAAAFGQRFSAFNMPSFRMR